MTPKQAIEIIEKYQENIDEQVLCEDDIYAPDKYYIAVSTILPMLKCMNCLFTWIAGVKDGEFIPRCEDKTNVPCCACGDGFIPPCEKSTLPDADELPFG